MIITILVVAFLIALNFLLLAFSCNKTMKKDFIQAAKPDHQSDAVVTKQLHERQLAPTGS
jgi:hypothetical protein